MRCIEVLFEATHQLTLGLHVRTEDFTHALGSFEAAWVEVSGSRCGGSGADH